MTILNELIGLTLNCVKTLVDNRKNNNNSCNILDKEEVVIYIEPKPFLSGRAYIAEWSIYTNFGKIYTIRNAAAFLTKLREDAFYKKGIVII
jgi:hypothetical protein